MTITAKTMIELRAKIYEAEGWVRLADESYAKRINSAYTVTFDAKTNRITAIRKFCA